MAIYVLTGVPGTGKSTISSHLAKHGYLVLDLKNLVNKKHIWKRKEHGAKVVVLSKLRREVLRELKRLSKEMKDLDIVVEGHLACEFNIPADLVVVLRTRPDILLKRLKKRKYPEPKIAENMQSEMLDYCTQVSEEHYTCPIIEVDSSGSLKETLNLVTRFFSKKGQRAKKQRIDWTRYFYDPKISKFLFR